MELEEDMVSIRQEYEMRIKQKAMEYEEKLKREHEERLKLQKIVEDSRR